MALVVGCNLPEPTTNTSVRWGLLTQAGCKIVRLNNADAGMLDKAASIGVFVLPIIFTGGSITSFLNGTNSNGVKNAVNPGFCGVIECGNEDYFNTSGGSYWNAWSGTITNTKSQFPNVKCLIQMVYINRQTWINDMYAAAASAGQSINNLVYGFTSHPYSTSDSAAVDPSLNQTYATYWKLNNEINNSSQGLAAHGAASKPVWVTEWGFATYAPPDVDGSGLYSTGSGSAGETKQNDYVNKTFAVFAQFPSVQASFQFEMEEDPFATKHREATLGTLRTTTSNWAIVPATSDRFKPSWNSNLARYAATGNPDFKAAGGGGGGGGGGAPGQMTLALDGSNRSRVIATVPGGTRRIHTAVAVNVAGEAAPLYPGTDLDPAYPFATPILITPPADHPYISAEAWDSTDATVANEIGTWTSWVATTPTPAQPLPLSTTLDATGITTNSAILNGTFDLQGVATGTAYFLYRPTGLGDIQAPATPISITSGGSPSWSVIASHFGLVRGGTSCTVPATGFTNGSELIAVAMVKGVSTTQSVLTAPAGWSQLLDENGVWLDKQFANAGGGVHRVSLYRKTASSEGTTTWTTDLTVNTIVEIFALTGGQSPAIVRASHMQSNATGLTFPLPQVTATTGDLQLSGCAFCNGDTTTYPGGLTESQDNQTDNATTDITLSVATASLASTGLTPSYTVTQNNASSAGNDTAATFTIALEPIAGSSSNVSTTINNLNPGTYDYEMYVKDVIGTTQGNNVGFEIVGTPTATTLPPTNVTQNSAILNAHIEGNGINCTAYFEYGLTTQYELGRVPATNIAVGTGSADISAGLTGLSNTQTYHFHVVVVTP